MKVWASSKKLYYSYFSLFYAQTNMKIKNKTLRLPFSFINIDPGKMPFILHSKLRCISRTNIYLHLFIFCLRNLFFLHLLQDVVNSTLNIQTEISSSQLKNIVQIICTYMYINKILFRCIRTTYQVKHETYIAQLKKQVYHKKANIKNYLHLQKKGTGRF